MAIREDGNPINTAGSLNRAHLSGNLKNQGMHHTDNFAFLPTGGENKLVTRCHMTSVAQKASYLKLMVAAQYLDRTVHSSHLYSEESPAQPIMESSLHPSQPFLSSSTIIHHGWPKPVLVSYLNRSLVK